MMEQSVQIQPRYEETPRSTWVIELATIADDIPVWGRNPLYRDRFLRTFWPTEPILASAIYTIVSRNAAFSWTLDGPPRTVKAVQAMLHEADLGRGWLSFITKLSVDLFTMDNGAFIEVIRGGDSPTAPVVGIAHLDSGRCRRTGVADWPVVYTDRNGAEHRLAPWQVITVEEFPSPIETMNGVQLCAVSRVLRMAQLLRDISIYKREKVSGSKPKSVHVVSGIKSQEIEDSLRQHKDDQMEQGFMRYLAPVILGTLDPNAAVSHTEIPIASLPDGFDEETTMRWYINLLAMGFGADYQDFAPLPGRGIGSGTQALVLHMKSRGKGPALFMKMLEHKFNFHGIIPRNVTFRYDEQDIAEDTEKAALRKTRAETDKIHYETGVLTAEAIRQRMLDKGDLDQEIFDSLQEEPDITPDVVAHDEERVGLQEGKARDFTKVIDYFHNFEHDPKGLNHCQGSSSNPYEIVHQDGIHKISLAYARGHDQHNSPQWFRFPKKLGDGYELESGIKIDIPPKGLWAKETEERADFEEEERLEAEGSMERDMAPALRKTFDDIKKLILGKKALKQNPGELLDDTKLWEEFRVRMVAAMLPHVRKGALQAAKFNADLGLAVDMDLVNRQVLDFSRVYTNDWWMRLQGTTRDGLRKAIVAWQETGLGKEGLPDLVNAIEPMFGKARAQRIATTEVTRIFDEGNKLAHLSAGIETEEWQTSKDALVCPICAPLDTERFPTDSGPRPVTDTHVGCRCARLPVANNRLIGGKR